MKSKSIFWHDLATTRYTGATADLLAEAEVPSVASDTNVRTSLSLRPIDNCFGCQIRKCTKEAEQRRLTEYYWPGQKRKWRKLANNGREQFGRSVNSACGWWSTSWRKSQSKDGVQPTNVHYISVQSCVVLLLRTQAWQITKLCPIL